MNDEYYSRVPVAYMLEGMRRWVEHGIFPGSFLQALLRNDLREAVGQADGANLPALQAWVRWLYNYAPATCWGSQEVMDLWHEHKGLEGLADALKD